MNIFVFFANISPKTQHEKSNDLIIITIIMIITITIMVDILYHVSIKRPIEIKKL